MVDLFDRYMIAFPSTVDRIITKQFRKIYFFVGGNIAATALQRVKTIEVRYLYSRVYDPAKGENKKRNN